MGSDPASARYEGPLIKVRFDKWDQDWDRWHLPGAVKLAKSVGVGKASAIKEEVTEVKE